MMIRQAGHTIFFLLLAPACFSQADSSKKFSFSGYGELYYNFDFSNPSNHENPSFLYNYRRHNEININLAYAKVAYQTKMARANLALMIGNYAHYNLAGEDEWSRFIYEANAGLRLSKKKNIWLDAGIMPSHIGFESAVGADCWNLSRSILAENSPYYEAGIRLSYTSSNNRLYTSLLYLNGWQHIRRPDNIQTPSAGLQVNYKIANDLTINYSNFIGTDKPDSLHALRTYHNFYFLYDPGKKWGFIIGFDLGTDTKINDSYAAWYSPVIISRIKFGEKMMVAGRIEYFYDKDQLIIITGVPNGFQTWGHSINFDYIPRKNVLLRLEERNFISKNSSLIINNNYRKHIQLVTASLSLKF